MHKWLFEIDFTSNLTQTIFTFIFFITLQFSTLFLQFKPSLSSSLLPPHSSNLSLLLHSKIHFPFLTTTFPYDIVTFFSSFNFTSLYYLLLLVLKNSSSRVLPLLFFSLSNVCSVFCERKNGYLEIGVVEGFNTSMRTLISIGVFSRF